MGICAAISFLGAIVSHLGIESNTYLQLENDQFMPED